MSELTANVHASAVAIAGQGVIILGKSGAGKSSLALELMRECLRDGLRVALVADDRVILKKDGKALVASAPENLAGLVEVRGAGIFTIAFQPSAILHLAVWLVDPGKAQRMPPDGETTVALGLGLPALFLPENETCACVRAILSHLGLFSPLRPGKIAV